MLKTLMLKRKIDDANKKLEELRSEKEELQKRSAEIETAIAEAETDEEKTAVDEEIEKQEAAESENAEAIEKLENEVNELEAELAEVEARQQTAPATEEPQVPAAETTTRTTKEIRIMNKRFADFSHEERSAFVEREDVKAFLEQTRSMMKGSEKRTITNGEYLIPTVVLDLIRSNVEEYSKLISKVNLQRVPGKARQTIMGLIPEAVWTEQCGKLNELDFSFGQVEVDGFKVGGFVAVCDALAEDADIDLIGELVNGIGQAIAYALDKAILYGTNVKMPKGIITAIDADSSLKTTNIITHASTVKGLALFQALLADTKKVNKKYGKAGLTWVMSSSTYTDLEGEGLNINAAGSIVSAMGDKMPVVGGDVVTLDFIPDGTIFVGCFDNYLLAERAGASIKTSDEYRFVEDQTVIKGTARYDGEPAVVSAFAVIGIGGNTPAKTDVTFATDSANGVG